MNKPKDSKTFITYFKNEEWEKILEKSKAAGLKPTTYIKRVSLFGKIKIYDLATADKLMLAINRYGNSVNQIARMANTTKSVYQSDIEKLQKDVKMMKADIERYLAKVEYELL